MLEFAAPRCKLRLYRVQPGDPYFLCESYLCEQDAPENTEFYGRYPNGERFGVLTLQNLRAGFAAYPGDSEAFIQLPERPLFRVV